MSKKITGFLVLAGLCALSLFLLNCGSSSSRPSGVLYALTQGSSGYGNNVSSFALDLDTGTLSLLNSNASTCPTAASPTNPEPCGLPLEILLDPAGANAFVLNQGIPSASVAPTIYSYTVNSDGSLGSPNLAATLATGDLPIAMARDAAGQLLFVITQGLYPSPTNCPPVGTPDPSNPIYAGCPSIQVFALSSSTLTLESGSPFYLSKIPTALSPIASPAGVSAPELLFVTNNKDIVPNEQNDNTLGVYTVSAMGVLTEQTNSPYAVSASDPISVQAVNTNVAGAGQGSGGLFVYVGQGAGAGAIYPFQVCTVQNAVCTSQDVQISLLLPLGETCSQPPCNNVPPSSVGAQPLQMVVDPTNSFLYGVSYGQNQVWGLKINTSAGTLTAQNPPNQPTGSQPVSLALHPTVNNTGQFLYVSNSNSDNITGFTLDVINGSMQSPTTAISPAAPSGIAVH